MFSTNANLQAVMGDFRIEHMMRCSTVCAAALQSLQVAGFRSRKHHAIIQGVDEQHRSLEKTEIVGLLEQQSTENPDQINLEDVIQKMERPKRSGSKSSSRPPLLNEYVS